MWGANPLEITPDAEASGTVVVKFTGTSDDAKFNGELGSITVTVVQPEAEDCRSLSAPMVLQHPYRIVGVTPGAAHCCGDVS